MTRSATPAAADASAIPAIDPRPKNVIYRRRSPAPRSSANAIAVTAPLPARPCTRPTVSGRYTSVRTTGWGRLCGSEVWSEVWSDVRVLAGGRNSIVGLDPGPGNIGVNSPGGSRRHVRGG